MIARSLACSNIPIHVAAARGAWGARGGRGYVPGAYLVTLTIPHSGDLVRDRERIAGAWRGLTKVAQREGWWSAYALTYEVTPGARGDGHVHAHVVAVSSWIPYDRLHREWRRLAPGAVILDVQAPSRSRKAAKAADYLAKYVTKGVQPQNFTGQKAAEWMVGARGKRKITTSRGFWRELPRRPCGACGMLHAGLGAPQSLRSVAPGMYLQGRAECAGVWIARGDPQAVLGLRDVEPAAQSGMHV